MAELDDAFAQACIAAVTSAARDLDTDPLVLARRLREGEVARLVRLLNAAYAHVESPGLRHRIDDLLSAVTDGRMPMFEQPESELDWALRELRQRRAEPPGDHAAGGKGEPEV